MRRMPYNPMHSALHSADTQVEATDASGNELPHDAVAAGKQPARQEAPPPSSESCPDCEAGIGAEHLAGCDWATCLATGGQRLFCELDPDELDHDCGRDVWTGEDHKSRAAIEYGFWCIVPKSGPIQRLARPEDAAALRDGTHVLPDGSRVLAECVWDPVQHRWVLADRRAGGGGMGVHSAGPAAAEPEEGAKASARAREDTPHSAPSAPEDTSDNTVPLGDRWRLLVAWASPPDIVSQPRPSLATKWAYAWSGPWTARTGLPRRLGQGYALVAIAIAAVLAWIEWITERPSRLAAAIVLAVFLAQIPPLSWLLN